MKHFLSFFCSLFVAAPLLLVKPTASFSAENLRTCAVKEVLKGGMYVYLRCQEKDRDVWLATVSREFKLDETVTFLDVPPNKDFYSKQLDRVFPEIILMDNLPPTGKRN
jgi:hypothetical protein